MIGSVIVGVIFLAATLFFGVGAVVLNMERKKYD